MNKLKLKQLLEQFFIEDIGDRDVTSDLLFTEQEQGTLTFIAKEGGVFSGCDVIQSGFFLLDEKASVQLFVKDGDSFYAGGELARITGDMAALLKAERVVLNLVQRMSAIATQAQKAVQILDGTKTKPCDTRKTTPGLRMLEKYAVRCGGASNHRYGLYDSVMIKDNHISFAGSISKAVMLAKSKVGLAVKIEVETESAEQVREAVEAGADIIMFDNRTPEQIKQLIPLVPVPIITEASGGINLENLSLYRDCGVDYISLGSLTHSVKALDISAKVKMLMLQER
ncbi:carboxylating nicotinate-nucleotide diphosphorylase [Peribacillus cavernae]|uniref:Probable nicotinate-nucleotide pyrophosphorylase [carboxylating] n=1 Tax=Peribacillus cavernae TaxID=1674310 RepID=A0A433HHL3_9BACI|nr:carboxylating nicotinate-nucleotide diphosphorylase [Peribacillus cavernae]MDQ0219354.1 nicotinate-nucleotide pyrophosphorylase (carboxylating) [Peribacillus cavernae]RUQ27769.1 carboxylating nicotinate-nucleotide diphosphorylase [Peribacillus cavernae]